MTDDRVKEFWSRLRAGSAQDVASFLASDPSFARARDEAGRLPLTVAAEGGSRELMQTLLGGGALLNEVTTDENRHTCLHAAAASERATVELCRWLVAIGAELNANDARGRTPLHVAVSRGDAALVDMLVEEGADPAMKDRDGASSMALAKAAGREDLVSILKKALR